MNYRSDREWADSLLDQVSAILKKNAMHIVNVEIAPDDIDSKQATDMVVRVSSGAVAVRVRRDNCKYRELTIRNRRSSGVKTEIHKIRDGHADWYLYGWTNGRTTIADWILVDLERMRDADLFDSPRREIPNTDRRTWFVAYTIREIVQCDALVAYNIPSGRAVKLGITQQRRLL